MEKISKLERILAVAWLLLSVLTPGYCNKARKRDIKPGKIDEMHKSTFKAVVRMDSEKEAIILKENSTLRQQEECLRGKTSPTKSFNMRKLKMYLKGESLR